MEEVEEVEDDIVRSKDGPQNQHTNTQFNNINKYDRRETERVRRGRECLIKPQ